MHLSYMAIYDGCTVFEISKQVFEMFRIKVQKSSTSFVDSIYEKEIGARTFPRARRAEMAKIPAKNN